VKLKLMMLLVTTAVGAETKIEVLSSVGQANVLVLVGAVVVQSVTVPTEPASVPSLAPVELPAPKVTLVVVGVKATAKLLATAVGAAAQTIFMFPTFSMVPCSLIVGEVMAVTAAVHCAEAVLAPTKTSVTATASPKRIFFKWFM